MRPHLTSACMISYVGECKLPYPLRWRKEKDGYTAYTAGRHGCGCTDLKNNEEKKEAAGKTAPGELLPHAGKKYPCFQIGVFDFHAFDKAKDFQTAIDDWLSETTDHLLNKDIIPEVRFITLGYVLFIYVQYEV